MCAGLYQIKGKAGLVHVVIIVLADFAEVQKATSDLQQLASQVEDELDDIPRETLQQIVDVLQAYLDSTEKP